MLRLIVPVALLAPLYASADAVITTPPSAPSPEAVARDYSDDYGGYGGYTDDSGGYGGYSDAYSQPDYSYLDVTYTDGSVYTNYDPYYTTQDFGDDYTYTDPGQISQPTIYNPGYYTSPYYSSPDYSSPYYSSPTYYSGDYYSPTSYDTVYYTSTPNSRTTSSPTGSAAAQVSTAAAHANVNSDTALQSAQSSHKT
ncbi:hypothetical protein FH972_022222 [Carpinus fangiana]|uniref:Uncharacterized protein n=1 Tax=Carpinus fangiana TaxID=176857 RepID=A0A5N6KS61_9ROSI|nr:hypothetical protein FH972_022222 [Carpinus fangiana]